MFATLEGAVDQVQSRLDFVMDSRERGVAEQCILDLMEIARHYGSPRWLTDESTPHFVRVRILIATARYLKNIDGYRRSQSGTEMVEWEHVYEAATFSEQEKRELAQIAGPEARPSGFGTVGTYAYDNRRLDSTAWRDSL